MPYRLRALPGGLTAAALLALSLAAGPSEAAPAPGPAPRAGSGAGPGPLAALALRPPMGWNNWAHYMCDIDEAKVLANADALVSSGLAAKGYDTVTVDDCWMTRSRGPAGELVPDPVKFPRGMAWLGSYLHARGLKFGIYEDTGALTCERYPGSGTPEGGGPDHFAQDVRQFASWGVDYIKMDGCNVWVAPGQTKEAAYREAYEAVARAIRSSGRPMVHSASAPAYFQNGEWGSPSWFSVLDWVGSTGQLWREGRDIQVYKPSAPATSRWKSVLGNYGYNRWLGRYAEPGNWNDPDFLIAGAPGLTAEEGRSQVALWAMMAAPFILSSEVSELTPAGLAALGNDDLIELDQDPMGRQAAVLATDGSTDLLARPLANGDRAVAVLNRTSAARRAVVRLADLGFPSECTVRTRNLWTGATGSTRTELSATVPAHGTAVWRLTPRGCAEPLPTGQLTGNGAQCADGEHTTGDGTVGLAPCTGGGDQRWTAAPDGTLRVAGQCLTSAGDAVRLADCDPAGAAAGQRWDARPDGRLTDEAGRCLDAPVAAGTDPAGPLRALPCGDHLVNQTWALPV
ncbi:ricin-type beta-trefoil lectin domain protein [Streptomyces sp. NPDC089919]|uniref:ricin-type beta-trefoil lectin domain protein n=1 Tax=Streptomyces sp. NPDC089919 TaxID=3155188 RepID=UPI0034285046